jgi:hypothetical protein
MCQEEDVCEMEHMRLYAYRVPPKKVHILIRR